MSTSLELLRQRAINLFQPLSQEPLSQSEGEEIVRNLAALGKLLLQIDDAKNDSDPSDQR